MLTRRAKVVPVH